MGEEDFIVSFFSSQLPKDSLTQVIYSLLFNFFLFSTWQVAFQFIIALKDRLQEQNFISNMQHILIFWLVSHQEPSFFIIIAISYLIFIPIVYLQGVQIFEEVNNSNQESVQICSMLIFSFKDKLSHDFLLLQD